MATVSDMIRRFREGQPTSRSERDAAKLRGEQPRRMWYDSSDVRLGGTTEEGGRGGAGEDRRRSTGDAVAARGAISSRERVQEGAKRTGEARCGGSRDRKNEAAWRRRSAPESKLCEDEEDEEYGMAVDPPRLRYRFGADGNERDSRGFEDEEGGRRHFSSDRSLSYPYFFRGNGGGGSSDDNNGGIRTCKKESSDRRLSSRRDGGIRDSTNATMRRASSYHDHDGRRRSYRSVAPESRNRRCNRLEREEEAEGDENGGDEFSYGQTKSWIRSLRLSSASPAHLAPKKDEDQRPEEDDLLSWRRRKTSNNDESDYSPRVRRSGKRSDTMSPTGALSDATTLCDEVRSTLRRRQPGEFFDRGRARSTSNRTAEDSSASSHTESSRASTSGPAPALPFSIAQVSENLENDMNATLRGRLLPSSSGDGDDGRSADRGGGDSAARSEPAGGGGENVSPRTRANVILSLLRDAGVDLPADQRAAVRRGAETGCSRCSPRETDRSRETRSPSETSSSLNSSLCTMAANVVGGVDAARDSIERDLDAALERMQQRLSVGSKRSPMNDEGDASADEYKDDSILDRAFDHASSDGSVGGSSVPKRRRVPLATYPPRRGGKSGRWAILTRDMAAVMPLPESPGAVASAAGGMSHRTVHRRGFSAKYCEDDPVAAREALRRRVAACHQSRELLSEATKLAEVASSAILMPVTSGDEQSCLSNEEKSCTREDGPSFSSSDIEMWRAARLKYEAFLACR